MPLSKGGWILRDMYNWNKAALLKHLWNLARNKDNLWVKWVHNYYMKSQDVQNVTVSIHASRSFQKIITQMDILAQLGGWEAICTGDKFEIRRVYNLLIVDAPKVHWGNITMKNIANPSAKFIT